MDVKKELVAYFELLYSVVVGSNLWISVHMILSMFNRKIKLKLHLIQYGQAQYYGMGCSFLRIPRFL